MNSRNLLALLAALVVLVALAVAVTVSQRPSGSGGGLLLPELKARLNDVDKIVVRTAGNKVLATLERQKDGWTVAEGSGYAADVGKIRKNLIALAEARILEEKTSNPELYSRLKVEDIDKEAAGGVQLDITSAGTTSSVIIGATGVGGGDRAYARRAGEATSWLVSGSFETPRVLTEWLDRSLVSIPASRIHSVTITQPDGATLRIRKDKPEATDFAVLDIPAGRQLSFPAAANGVSGGLASLSFDKVEPAAEFSPGDVRPAVARFETFDGLVIETRTFKLPTGTRVRFAASADKALADRLAPPAPAEAPPETGTGGAQPATPPAGKTRKSFGEVEAEAAQINARLGAWVYALPDYDADQLVTKIDALLAPKAPSK